MILSLHGAGVEGIGQARAYAPKDWAYIIAPTNRRPFGFDWEEWGRLQGLNALADATAHFNLDPTRQYLTGHSMGGHGTWQLGVHDAGRWAVIAPSAGWSSFETYTGRAIPDGLFGRARNHSHTNDFVENLVDKAIYIIHGSADDNVPLREGRAMFERASAVSDDVQMHEEPGAGHWWNGTAGPDGVRGTEDDFEAQPGGADCVDWPPLMALMQARTVDPMTLDFHFRSASPAYSPQYSYVRIASRLSPMRDVILDSAFDAEAGAVVLDTDNSRSLVLDGAALRARDVDEVIVDGVAFPVPDGPLMVGPTSGKQAGLNGPFNQVYHQPWCYVWPDDRPVYADLAAYLITDWQMIGNGHACALPVSALTDEIASTYNLIHLGRAKGELGFAEVPFEWDDREVRFRDQSVVFGALQFVHPGPNGRLNALIASAGGVEHLLYRTGPFSSSGGLPDYLIWAERGAAAAGFFDAEWGFDPAFVVP